MHWNSFDEFIHMGGYGLYVWGSYGVTLALMLLEPVLAMQRKRHALAAAADGQGNGHGHGSGVRP
jgi:heme exporter protein D